MFAVTIIATVTTLFGGGFAQANQNTNEIQIRNNNSIIVETDNTKVENEINDEKIPDLIKEEQPDSEENLVETQPIEEEDSDQTIDSKVEVTPINDNRGDKKPCKKNRQNLNNELTNQFKGLNKSESLNKSKINVTLDTKNKIVNISNVETKTQLVPYNFDLVEKQSILEFANQYPELNDKFKIYYEKYDALMMDPKEQEDVDALNKKIDDLSIGNEDLIIKFDNLQYQVAKRLNMLR